MKKTNDTSTLENIAEDKISYELQKYDLLVAKPKSDRSGTDLLVFAEIADSVKFCRIQSKGRSLEHSNKSYIEISKEYVTDGFLCFLYLYFSNNSDQLYVFLPTDIRQWKLKNEKYRLDFTKINSKEKLNFYIFNSDKAQLIKTLINLAEVHGEFRILNYGIVNLKMPLPKISAYVTNGK
jgi:hypothetical protein